MAKPKLSIIIPVYNAASSIAPLAQKILAQKMQDLELILVDDASQDNSWELIQKLAKQDKRIIAKKHSKNKGQGEARNLGLKLARGEFIMFCDDDDDIDKNMISSMVAQIKKGADLITCAMRFVWLDSGKVEDVWTNPVLSRQPNESIENYTIRLLGEDGRLYSSTNKIFKASIIHEQNLKFLKRDFGEDTLFVLSYLKYSSKLDFIPKPYYIYHKGTEASTMSRSSVKYQNWQRNFQDVSDWAGATVDPNWLSWLKYRWTVSFVLAVMRQPDTSFKEKRKIIQKAHLPKELPKIGKLQIIGFKKWIMEITIKSLVKLFF